MRWLLCLLALVAFSASADELRQGGVDEEDGSGTLSRPNVLLRALFASNAPYIEDDSGTVMHCTGENFSANTLTCSTGGAWTTTGTVTTDSGFPLFPFGTAGTQRKGLKSWSGSNYLALGAGLAADTLDFGASQDFSVCVVWQPKSGATEKVLASDGTSGVDGWYLSYSGTTVSFCLSKSGASTCTGDTAPPMNSLNITCVGRSGTTQALKHNLNAVVTTTAVTPYVPANTTAAFIGHYSTGLEPDAIIYELWASTTAASDALFTKIATRFWGLASENMTLARASSQSFTYGGSLFYAAPGTPAVDPNRGIEVETTATNLALRSEEAENAAWFATAGLVPGVTANGAVAPDGTTTMDLLDNTGGTSTGNIQQGYAIAATAGPFVASVWARPFGASNVASANFYCVTDPTTACSCACQHADGTACTCTASAAGANACTGSKTITKLTRIAVTATCTTAETVPIPFFMPGLYTVSQDKAYFWGMQLEAPGAGGPGYATSYIPTAGTVASRSYTQLSAANPLATGDKRWCVDATYTPSELHSWSIQGNNPFLWTLGGNGGTNDAEVYLGTTGSLNLQVDDASDSKTGSFGGIGTDLTAVRWNVCNNNGTHTAFKNGVSASNTPSGTGTGVIATMPSTIYVGAGAGYGGIDGWVKSFQLGRSTDNGAY